jgi:crotonobetainyl-CoA:carnitine CoA-transferase CaiB-like acyl-CoA transferase
VYSIADIANDPHYEARDMILRLLGPDGVGELLVPGVVPKFADAPSSVRWLGRSAGADSEAILREIGLDDAELDRLERASVIHRDHGPALAASVGTAME